MILAWNTSGSTGSGGRHGDSVHERVYAGVLPDTGAHGRRGILTSERSDP